MTDDFRLPRLLVNAAAVELERHGMIHADTAALLIEAGAYPDKLTEQVWEQAMALEGDGI